MSERNNAAPRFRFTSTAIDVTPLAVSLAHASCGGYASFEGWVRDHNEGHAVTHLEYEAFETLAVREGERIVEEAIARFGVERAACVHRVGDLAIGELAVWVGVSARHRDEAFRACRYIIDEVKHRVPIWKKEHYVTGDSGWVNCERCATAPQAAQAAHDPGRHDHSHHDHSHHDAHDERPHTPLVPDYSRQMALAAVGVRGQARLRASSVLVVGAGGLGVPVLGYLAGAGIGRLGIVDGDVLEPSNLHRQTAYSLADCGQRKAQLAAARVRELNPDVHVDVHAARLDATNGESLVARYDLVVDCTDNFTTKFLLNDLLLRLRKPGVFASVYQYEGQLQVVRGDADAACLRCVWPEATRDGLVGNCAEAGVLGPVPGIFGSLQALEALRILLDLPGALRDEMLMFDLTTFAIARVRARRHAPCTGGPCVRAAAADAARSTPGESLEIAFDDLEEAVHAGYAIVDVRDADELAEFPTPASRSTHLPLADLLAGATPAAGRAGVLVVCARGGRSLAAAEELLRRGVSPVRSLRAGVLALRART